MSNLEEYLETHFFQDGVTYKDAIMSEVFDELHQCITRGFNPSDRPHYEVYKHLFTEASGIRCTQDVEDTWSEVVAELDKKSRAAIKSSKKDGLSYQVLLDNVYNSPQLKEGTYSEWIAVNHNLQVSNALMRESEENS